jgi:hypothetical protein
MLILDGEVVRGLVLHQGDVLGQVGVGKDVQLTTLLHVVCFKHLEEATTRQSELTHSR